MGAISVKSNQWEEVGVSGIYYATHKIEEDDCVITPITCHILVMTKFLSFLYQQLG